MRSRYLVISVLCLAVFVVVGTVLLRATGFRPKPDAVIDAGSVMEIQSGSAASKPVLRIAVSAMISPRDTFESYEGFADYIADELGMESELFVRKTYREVNGLLSSGAVDVAFICTGAYVIDRDSTNDMELLVTPIVRGQQLYYADIIVPRDSETGSLLELEGQRFAYVDELSNTGRNAPRRLLDMCGFDPGTFFSEAVITGSHDKSIRAVASQLVDGASVDHLILEAMMLRGDEAAHDVRIVERIGPFGMPPVVVPTSLDPEMREKIRDVFLGAGDDPEAMVFLDILGIDAFRLPDPSEYDSMTKDETLSSIIIRER